MRLSCKELPILQFTNGVGEEEIVCAVQMT